VTLADEVILLRPFTEDDLPAIVAACQDPEIPRWTSVPIPYTEADARAWLESTEEETFAIVDRSSDELLGSIGVRYFDGGIGEVGYWVKREARGRGVATRALELIAGWALVDKGLDRFQLRADVANEPSQRVAEKAGFVREGVLRSSLELKGERHDVVMYSLIREDLAGPPRATTRSRA
jgi:RimJ/RimL family protein N-acetyltransferase